MFLSRQNQMFLSIYSETKCIEDILENYQKLNYKENLISESKDLNFKIDIINFLSNNEQQLTTADEVEKHSIIHGFKNKYEKEFYEIFYKGKNSVKFFNSRNDAKIFFDLITKYCKEFIESDDGKSKYGSVEFIRANWKNIRISAGWKEQNAYIKGVSIVEKEELISEDNPLDKDYTKQVKKLSETTRSQKDETGHKEKTAYSFEGGGKLKGVYLDAKFAKEKEDDSYEENKSNVKSHLEEFIETTIPAKQTMIEEHKVLSQTDTVSYNTFRFIKGTISLKMKSITGTRWESLNISEVLEKCKNAKLLEADLGTVKLLIDSGFDNVPVSFRTHQKKLIPLNLD